MRTLNIDALTALDTADDVIAYLGSGNPAQLVKLGEMRQRIEQAVKDAGYELGEASLVRMLITVAISHHAATRNGTDTKVVNVTDPMDAFHAHLDICQQCRDNPFALCAEGSKLLHQAATKQPDDQPQGEEKTDGS